MSPPAVTRAVAALEARLGTADRKTNPFANEEAERTAYRVELERLRVYVSMGEGI